MDKGILQGRSHEKDKRGDINELLGEFPVLDGMPLLSIAHSEHSDSIEEVYIELDTITLFNDDMNALTKMIKENIKEYAMWGGIRVLVKGFSWDDSLALLENEEWYSKWQLKIPVYMCVMLRKPKEGLRALCYNRRDNE